MKLINFIAIIFIGLVLSSCDLSGIEEVEPENVTVYDVLNRQNRFNQFLEAAEKAGLTSLLQGSDAYTWFIPNDEAFESLDIDINSLSNDELKNVLEYHILPGDLHLIDLPQGYVNSISGASFWFKANINELTSSASRLDLNQFRNETRWNNYNLNAVNGRVNEISFVIIPPAENLWQILQDQPDLSSFVSLVEKSGQISVFQSEEPLSVFAPSNDAFTGVDIDLLTTTEAITIVNNHTIQGELFFADDVEDGLIISNVNGNDINFGDGTVNNILINEVDLIANNGVIHKIDEIIML
jgi:transforming growth factor-beta-induced protein